MDPIAFISDIHSNLEALTAVLADIDGRGVKTIYCLGDVIGYGPQPRECMDIVIDRCTVTLMGNHDFAAMFEPENFNQGAELACYWTRQQLEQDRGTEVYNRRLDFMGAQPVKYDIRDVSPAGTITLAHGSPRRPINEYIFPDDIYNHPAKISSVFDRFEAICLVGHTHVPGVFLRSPDFFSPDEVVGTYNLEKGKQALINVGSVGQPRDRDNRASYAILHPDKVEFVRVPYDFETTVQKVLAIKDLDDYLGTRLREGR
jgi:predicted phosphodiesterase